MSKPKGHELKKEIAKEFKISPSILRVKTDNGAMNVYIKDFSVSAEKVKLFLEKYQSYQRDMATGCILRGGNFFVFVMYDGKPSEAETKIIEKYADRIEYGQWVPESTVMHHMGSQIKEDDHFPHLTENDVKSLVSSVDSPVVKNYLRQLKHRG